MRIAFFLIPLNRFPLPDDCLASPRLAFPENVRMPADQLLANFARDFVDTEYAARLDRSTGAICITSPPSGIMAVGGYRFLSGELQEWAARLRRVDVPVFAYFRHEDEPTAPAYAQTLMRHAR